MVWTKLREAASPEPSDEAPENRLACLRALNSEASGWVPVPCYLERVFFVWSGREVASSDATAEARCESVTCGCAS